MFRTVRTLVASAVFSAALFALTGSALAMPPSETHDSGVQSAPIQTVADHGFDPSPTIWIVVGLLAVALAATATVAAMRHRGVSPDAAGR